MNRFRGRVVLLADHPELAADWARFQWLEWGTEPGSEEYSLWLNNAAPMRGRSAIPAAFIALSETNEVLGGVGIQQYDFTNWPDRSPWVVGTMVRSDQRSKGVGHALLTHLEQWAREAGYRQVWVATGGRAIRFYQQCGYAIVETVPSPEGGLATILLLDLQTP